MGENVPVEIIKFSIKGRKFESQMFRLDQKPPAFIGKLIEFFEIWKKLYDGNIIPRRQDLNFESLKGWHTNIRMVHLGEKIEDDKRNIILGETYQYYWGKRTMINQIGKLGDDAPPVLEGYNKFLSYFYNYHYAVSIGLAPNREGSFTEIIWLDLPLSSDGKKIDYLITALIPKP